MGFVNFYSLDERDEKEARRAIIAYIVIGTILMLFSYYKTGMVLNAAGIVLYLISTMRKRAAKKAAEETYYTQIRNIDGQWIERQRKLIDRDEEFFSTAWSAEKSISTTNHTKEHEKGEKNVVSE